MMMLLLLEILEEFIVLALDFVALLASMMVDLEDAMEGKVRMVI